ncbi:MAG: DUF456 domain-containing protein [Thermodesulfobacteriota bacterium]
MPWPPSLADLLLVIFLVMGIIGTFLPILPGPSIIVVGALIHGLLTDFQPLTLLHIMILTLFALAAWGSQYLLTILGARHFGGSQKGIWGATIGLIIGFFIPIAGGIFIGAFAGGLLCELYFEQKELREAAKSGAGAVVGILASFALELLIALGMAYYIWRLF